jgi:sporulation protein YlmC with PRC-barrel domain
VPDIDAVRSWQGRTLVDRDGNRIGTIDAIYLDDQTGQPEWALANTGLFGTRSTLVPLVQAAQTGDEVQVPYDKQLVKDAPRIDPDQHLSEAEEQRLWRHYGLYYDTIDRDVATGRDATSRGAELSEAEHEVVLREEEPVVEKRVVPRERVRLDKDTVAGEERVAEQVRKEQIHVQDEDPKAGRHERRRRR